MRNLYKLSDDSEKSRNYDTRKCETVKIMKNVQLHEIVVHVINK